MYVMLMYITYISIHLKFKRERGDRIIYHTKLVGRKRKQKNTKWKHQSRLSAGFEILVQIEKSSSQNSNSLMKKVADISNSAKNLQALILVQTEKSTEKLSSQKLGWLLWLINIMQSHFNFWNFTANETSFFMAETKPCSIKQWVTQMMKY